MRQATTEYDHATAERVAALEAEIAALRLRNAELVASRADLAGKLLGQGKVIDELRDRIAKLEIGGKDAVELICELVPYVPKYFLNKWEYHDWLDRVATLFCVDVAPTLMALKEQDKHR